MKRIIRIIIVLLLLITSNFLNAQVAINEDNSNPDASAILDVSSTNKGILIPRMSTTQRDSISNPATGLLVYDTDENSFWYYNNSTWAVIGTGAFMSDNGVTYANNSSDDFLFGADSLNFGSGEEVKLFFDKNKGAFRVGKINGSFWDESNVGDYSIAFGINTEASSNVSTAFGAETKSSGFVSTAFGWYTEASGDYSTAFGANTIASENYATAFGYNTAASGKYSTAFGFSTTALSYGEMSLGTYNTTYTANGTTSYDSDDRLFVIGNGTSSSALSDAMVVYKNGNAELNGALTIDDAYTFPTTDGTINQVLTTDGSGVLSWSDENSNAFISENGLISTNNTSDDFILGTDDLTYSSGTEKKLFFDRSKGAFRAGSVNSTNWDNSNIGSQSAAFGYNTIADGALAVAFGNETEASGIMSAAFGDNTVANGLTSTAFGDNTTASGDGSTAFGFLGTASGDVSTAFGKNTTASGNNSTAFGVYTNAFSYGETSLGIFSTTYTPNSTSSYDSDDRLFVIGNGTSSSDLSDALIIYKNGNTEINGNVGIGTTATNAILEIEGTGTLTQAISGIGYLNTSGAGTGSYNGEFSIYVDDRIAAKAFIAHSDERIKDIKGLSNNEADLAILKQIEITDYEFKDKVKEGNTKQKKVIAQQVAKVYPQAVTKNITEVVPDIYQIATLDKNGWVVFNDEFRIINPELQVGEKIQIIFEGKKELLTILETKENTFRVEQPKTPISSEQPETVFIYGREVNDFHTVDYEAISMLNVSATQQLVKENEKLKKRITVLEQQVQKVNQLEQQNAETKAMLEQIQAQLKNQ